MNENCVAPLETQVGLVQLQEALDTAFASAGVAEPERASVGSATVATRVVIDAPAGKTRYGMQKPIARAAWHRITGFAVARAVTPQGARNFGGRWQYMPPRFEKNHLVGRPSITPTQKIRITCEKCGKQETLFSDIVIAATRNGGVLKCSACKSEKVRRDRTYCTCSGCGQLKYGDDELFSEDRDTVKQELDSLAMIHEAGYDDNTRLIMPRLWCGYDVKPDVAFDPEDRLAEMIVRRGLTPAKDPAGNPVQPVSYMLPFDLVMQRHIEDEGKSMPPLRQLVLETMGDAGWTDKAELAGAVRSAWRRVWLRLPSFGEKPSAGFNRDRFSL